MQTPDEERYLMSMTELKGKIDVLLGGRAAEELVFGEISTGAANDLTKATDIARKMITDYGMSERFKNVALTKQGNAFLGPRAEPTLGKEYSDSTQQYVDEEIARIVEESYARAQNLLKNKLETLEKVTAILLEQEMIEGVEFKELVGASAE
jgi:cell division protease FtsH